MGSFFTSYALRDGAAHVLFNPFSSASRDTLSLLDSNSGALTRPRRKGLRRC